MHVDNGGFTPEQVQMMDGWMRKAGTHPDQQQAPAAPVVPPGTEATPSPEVMAYEAQAIDQGFPIADSREFETPNFSGIASSLGESLSNEQLMQVDTTARAWLSTMELPRGIGNFVASECARINGIWDTMTPATQATWTRQQEVFLENKYGAEWPQKQALAQDFIRQVGAKHPDFITFLEDSGAGNAASVVCMIVEHATRQEVRYRSRGRK
ncbi:hypothetical protein [Rhodospirillaceae bacterium SYSU D60014]|uniref:hypothetical protein n=1 Tax=Virgifigura deserti TaxID=2268457 RepID=UPI000E66A38A